MSHAAYVAALFCCLLVVNVSTQDTSCTDSDASWLAWSEWSACSDNCGSCGVHMRTRTCLTLNAQCQCTEGQATMIEHCNLEICKYPRTTCCNNLKVTSLGGRFACLANSTFTGQRTRK